RGSRARTPYVLSEGEGRSGALPSPSHSGAVTESWCFRRAAGLKSDRGRPARAPPAGTEPMDRESQNQRLSRITTRWSLVCKAHSGPVEGAREAQLELRRRYGGAIDRYLLGALRDPEAAEELSQEFALRFIRGDFRGVDPRRGRFRDYVKAVLFRLVAHHYRRRQEQPRPLPAD